MSAGTLIRDEVGRVLLVEPSYKKHWDIPGGACEEGEPPWRTARRERAEDSASIGSSVRCWSSTTLRATTGCRRAWRSSSTAD
ncbi:MAG TPA: NUDIX hydrolase [Amycolatopsis sp.]|nr:NUDIX hydrolase [Amycolatopsis sp.]